MILGIRTDSTECELILRSNQAEFAHEKWQAHRTLARDLPPRVVEMLTAHKMTMASLQGIVVYIGPGSFTGLRIGVTVANALATELNIPIAGQSGKTWFLDGVKELQASPSKRMVTPEYGSEPHITSPK